MTNEQNEAMARDLLKVAMSGPNGAQRVIALAALAQLVGRDAFEQAWAERTKRA